MPLEEKILVTSLCGDSLHSWMLTGGDGIVVCSRCLLALMGIGEIQEYRRQFLGSNGVLMTVTRTWPDAQV